MQPRAWTTEALTWHVTAFKIRKSGESCMLRQQSRQPSGTHAPVFMGQTHTRAHTCTKGNHCPQIVRHVLGACGGQNLTIERAVAGTSAPLTCPAAPNTEAESPTPQKSWQHFNNSGWSPSCFCTLTSPSQIKNSSILDPSLQLSCKDNGNGLVTLSYNVCS